MVKWRNYLNVRRLAGLSILVGFMLNSGLGRADSWQHAVSSRASTEFDSNPAMSPAYPGGVWRALFEPGYTLTGRVGANELKAGLALQLVRSSNRARSQNRDSPSVFLNWLRQSDAGEFGISSRYEEIATRDAAIEAIGSVPIDSTRASRSISGSWSKALSERSTLSADGSYEGVSYRGGTFIDYVTRSGGLRFNYALSEHSVPFLRMSYAEYEPAGGNLPHSFANAILGWNWKPSDYLEGNLQVGRTRASGQEMTTLGAAAMRYTGQRTVLVLNADHQLLPSGLGDFVTVDQVNGKWSYDLSERSRTGIDLGWRKNRLVNIVNRTKGAWLQHELNPLWGARTYYLHSINEGGAGGSASSNILGLTLIYNRSDF